MMDFVFITQCLASFCLCLQSLENYRIFKATIDGPHLKKIEIGIFAFAALLPVSVFFAAPILFLIYLRLIKLSGSVNGGSDSMIVSVLIGLLLSLIPSDKNLGLLYIGAHSFLSYLIPGIAKMKNLNWLNGSELKLIFEKSFYPVPNLLKFPLQNDLARKVIATTIALFECSILIGLLNSQYMIGFCIAAFVFHLSNAVVLGLHRFTWAWVATYPALLYFMNLLHESL